MLIDLVGGGGARLEEHGEVHLVDPEPLVGVDGAADKEASIDVPLGPEPAGFVGFGVAEKDATGIVDVLVPVVVATWNLDHRNRE